jgi:hypothetical protein
MLLLIKNVPGQFQHLDFVTEAHTCYLGTKAIPFTVEKVYATRSFILAPQIFK